MALLIEAVPGSGWRPDGQQFVQVLKAISESFYPDSNASIRWEGPRYPGFAVNHSGVQADESLKDAHMDRQLCFESQESAGLCAGTQSYAALSQHSDWGGVHEETVTGLNRALLQIMPTASKETSVVITFCRSEHSQ